ncbi:MAG TPA: hypothetical protein VFK69_12885, partial [Candidatus Eisenbacteria bacterium]|nr:hypothetical protein [Candidatus Eisenbacteria bacterium]
NTPGATTATGTAGGATATPGSATSAAGDSSLTLRGGQEGTVFHTLTVEGEDRIHVDFERPPLELDLDPVKVPGLDLGSARDVLDRTTPDLVTPLTSTSTADRSPYLAHPWLSQFGSGVVAKFHPDARGVERWKLVVANAKGTPVASFAGRGEPPHEIVWDGRSTTGEPVLPGLTYSYVFEAYDKAGNKRNVVGEGFRVSAFRTVGPQGSTLAFSGSLLDSDTPGASGTPAPIVLEAATWLNADAAGQRPLRVTVTARSAEQAGDIAQRVVHDLAARTIGNPARIRGVTQVEPDAPEGGVVKIGPESAR